MFAEGTAFPVKRFLISHSLLPSPSQVHQLLSLMVPLCLSSLFKRQQKTADYEEKREQKVVSFSLPPPPTHTYKQQEEITCSDPLISSSCPGKSDHCLLCIL